MGGSTPPHDPLRGTLLCATAPYPSKLLEESRREPQHRATPTRDDRQLASAPPGMSLRRLRWLRGHEGAVNAVRYSRDGEYCLRSVPCPRSTHCS